MAKRNIVGLSKSNYAPVLYEFLEGVKAQVADIRIPLQDCKPEMEKDLRIALCNTIDIFIIDKIKSAALEQTAPEDDYT